MTPLQEWAWYQYDKCVRTVPGTVQCKAAWKIHIAAGRVNNMQAMKAKPVQPPTIVKSISEMDKVAFAMHFSKRHKGSLADLNELPPNMPFEVEQMYRSFHLRLHETGVGLRHEHEPEAIEDSVDRAIECLIENRNFGWKELAGIEGLVAVFPDGQIATRVGGRTIHHDTIESATDRLVGA